MADVAKAVHLDRLSWKEAEALLAQKPIALLPLGSTEAHGPHLPLGTDVIISEGMAVRAAEALHAQGISTVILPTLAYAVTEYASSFAGTLSISPEVVRALLLDIARAVQRQGVEMLVLVNSHLEPGQIAILRSLAKDGLALTGLHIVFPDKTRKRWVGTLTEEFQRSACHAGSYETSLVLVDRPEWVRDNIRQELPELPIDLTAAMQAGVKRFEGAGATQAYFGAPALATLEEGHWTYERLTEMIVTTVLEARENIQPSAS
ncbi:MAG: creatininase family protein [Myxococcota bacterium]